MEYRLLGRTGLRVSPLCLGTMNFGMRRGRRADRGGGGPPRSWTAPSTSASTSSTPPTCTAERARASPSRSSAAGSRRAAVGASSIVLATKVYGCMRRLAERRAACRRSHIRQACDDSLRRLQTDHIDLYQMHHVDRDTPWDEIWQAMELLVQQGKVLYVGSSNFAGWHIVQANEAAARRHFLGLVVGAEPLQPHRPHRRARGAARVRALRGRRHPVEPARWRAARRRARRPRGRRAAGNAEVQARVEQLRPQLEA